MTFVPEKQQRAFDPTRPLYAWRELTFPTARTPDETNLVVPRGHRIPEAAIASLTPQALHQLFWVKHVDHVPVPNITPADQIVSSPPVTCPHCGADMSLPPKHGKPHKPQRAAG